MTVNGGFRTLRPNAPPPGVPACHRVEAADHAADIRADLERKGLPIGGYDLLIAGHARSRGLIVITENLREFEQVAGLRCEDWEATG